MRILMLGWRGPFHPKAGGAEVYTRELLSRMVEKGHEVEWHSAGYGGNEESICDGIRLTYGAAGMKIYASGHFYALRKQKEFDIIIDQINTFGFLTYRVKHTPVVSLVHQLAVNVWDAETKPPVSWIGKFLEPRVLKTYRDIPFVTVSPSTEQDVKEIGGWKSQGVIVYNGIELSDKKYEKTEDPTMVFLARFGAKAKRLNHAVEVFKNVRKQIPNAKFRVIGRGTPPDYIHGVEGVEIHQNVTDEERDQLIGSSWCCVATSTREGWGRMVLESAMFETPSVVYDVHGLRDAVVDGVTGFVVPETPEAASTKIVELFQNDELRNEINKKAFENAQGFTWDSSTDEFEAFLKQHANT